MNLWGQLRRQVAAVMGQMSMLAVFSASTAMGLTLDFEDLPSDAIVRTQYVQRGVDGELPCLICPINDADLAIFNREPAIPDVVERWAPVIYQDVAKPKQGADLITMVEF